MSIADKLATIAANEQRVYDAGKEAQEQAFWDAYQDGGNRVTYANAFSGDGWANAIFKPRYNMAPNSAYMMFRFCTIQGDLVNILQELGVTIDFSNSTNFGYTFSYAMGITRIGIINTTSSNSLSSTFQYARALKTIDKLVLRTKGDQTFSSVFDSDGSLQNITIEGVIGNNISFGDSPLLTHDSLVNIISCLQDITGTSNTRTLTLGATNLAKLTDTEKAVATGKGWTLA